MALRKKTDKKVTGLSAIVTIAFYVIIAAVFWNVGGGEIIKEFVITAAAGRKPPPPPPPKRTPPKIKLKQPPKIRPKFKVVQPKFHGSHVRPDFGKAIIPVMDNESDLNDITRMAKMYETSAISQSISQMKTAALDIGSKLGFGLSDIAGGKRTVVVGQGRRMRAKITLAMFGGDTYLKRESTIPAMLAFLKENTNISVSTEIKRIESEQTFSGWYKFYERRIAGGSKIAEMDPETSTLKELGKEVCRLHGGDSYYRPQFVEGLQRIWRGYLKKRFPLAADKMEGRSYSSFKLLEQIKRLYRLPRFQQEGIIACTEIIDRYKPEDAAKAVNMKKLGDIHKYLREAELLHYPFVFCLEVSQKSRTRLAPDEILDHFRAYVRNGGFLYLDDLGRGVRERGGVHQAYRYMARCLIEEPPDPEEKALLATTHERLRANDRHVAGFKLGSNSPNPFHPKTSIAITVPRRCDVDLRIYNRVGRLVRNIALKDLSPGRYGSRLKTQSQAPVWDCLDDAGQPVESGAYFVQMQSGLFQETHRIDMSTFRMLDTRTHPLFTSYYTFKGVPTCKVDVSQISHIDIMNIREYGTCAFGWYRGEHMSVLYTEWAGILRGVGSRFTYKSPVDRYLPARKFFTNILVFALGQPGSLAKRI